MKLFLYILALIVITGTAFGQTFDDNFTNKTLRLDYIFSGNEKMQYVSLKGMSQIPQWTGRHHNLDTLARNGNGQITVKDAESGRCLYKESFSSLFQEWLTTPEAKTVDRSFENTLLIPYPKQKILIEVAFRTKEGKYEAMLKHVVDPMDILIERKGFTHITPYSYIHKGGKTDKCINVAILAEGYSANEMQAFRDAAKIACEQILLHSPFKAMKDRFNFIAVESVSEDSGVSVPRNNTWKKTACSSHFDTFYSDRYLTTSHLFDVHDILAGIPYNHIIILANTDVYGGGGIYNSYTLTTTGHPEFKPVVVHEFGHSFGGLADEYYYDDGDIFENTYPFDVEPWEPNITTFTDFRSKWEPLLQKGTPVPTPVSQSDKYKTGVYEGGGYSSKGVYRPAIDCRMKTNTCKDFCAACQRAMRQLIIFDTE